MNRVTAAARRYMFGNQLIEMNKIGIVFIVVTIFQTITVISGAVANIILNHQLGRDRASISSYFLSGVVMIIMISMMYFACDSVVNENSFELLGFSIASIIMFVRLIYGIVEEYSKLQVLITSAIVILCQIIQFILLVPLYRSFGWRSYRLIGTNESLIKRYQIYCFFIALMKIDLLLSCLVLLMGVFFVQFDLWYSYLGFGIGMFLTLISAPICIIAVRRENIYIVVLWLLFSLGMPVYLIYKIVVFWLNGKIKDWHGTTLKDIDLKIMLTALAASAIVLRVLLCITLVIVTFNFGKGLISVYKRSDMLKSGQSSNSSESDPIISQEAVMKIGPNGEIIFQ